MKPILAVLAGPNGAGKSTYYQTRLKQRLKAPFVNADEIQKFHLRDSSLEASYTAASKAADIRQSFINKSKSFVTETVFSHPSKIDLLKKARDAGYYLWLIHIGVAKPELCVARVRARVQEGGHDVPADRIHKRYEMNQPLIRKAAQFCDRSFVYDNSYLNDPFKLLLEFTEGTVVPRAPTLPGWARNAYGGLI